MYTGMAQAWAAAMAGHDDEQLAAFLALFDQLHKITQVEIARLRDTDTHDPEKR
jgi:hypothetical protein